MVRVRERHLDGLRFAGQDEPVTKRRAQCDVFAEIRLPREVRHLPGAARELANIDADERRRAAGRLAIAR